jgi:uncharacterized protein
MTKPVTMNLFKFSEYTVITDIINDDETNPKRIIYSTRSGRVLVMTDEVLKQIQAADYANVSDKVLSTLLKMEFLVPAEENEFSTVLDQNYLYNQENEIASFTLQPGANCQLGCHYCGQKHTKDYLPESLYPKLIDRINEIMAKKPYKALSITWYGGEPLMAYKQIRELSPMLLELAKKYKTKYIADMITNGLSLKPDLFTELVDKYKVSRYQITIDGMKEHHDTRRITKSGEATYDIIMENIAKCCALPIYTEKNAQINIRCNIDKSNYQSVLPFIQMISEKEFASKVSLAFSPIVDWGDVKGSEGALTKEDFAEIEIDWYMEVLRRGIKVDVVPDRTYGPCMVVNPDSEVYDAFGNIFPCYEFPYTEMYQNDKHIIGNLRFPSETYNQDVNTRDWFQVVDDGKTWCKKCKFFPVCGGSCPKQWMGGTPACPSFKFNIEDRLILQYIMENEKVQEVMA